MSNDLPDDYEPCGKCGFDHEYEQREAFEWHQSHLDDNDDEYITELDVIKFSIWAVKNHEPFDIRYRESYDLLNMISTIEDRKRKGLMDVLDIAIESYVLKLKDLRKVMRIMPTEICK